NWKIFRHEKKEVILRAFLEEHLMSEEKHISLSITACTLLGVLWLLIFIVLIILAVVSFQGIEGQVYDLYDFAETVIITLIAVACLIIGGIFIVVGVVLHHLDKIESRKKK
ncbi:MAG: hypothetical protein ACO2ZM_08665, partial [Francisellaceae bacterium]